MYIHMCLFHNQEEVKDELVYVLHIIVKSMCADVCRPTNYYSQFFSFFFWPKGAALNYSTSELFASALLWKNPSPLNH